MPVPLLCSYILAVTLFYSNEGKHISLRLHLAHHLHMPASTILLLIWPFPPLQQIPDVFRMCPSHYLWLTTSPSVIKQSRTKGQARQNLLIWAIIDICLGWGFGETVLRAICQIYQSGRDKVSPSETWKPYNKEISVIWINCFHWGQSVTKTPPC